MYKETLIKATHAGAAELKKFFNGKFTIGHKEGINDLVTQADFASDKAIRSIIKSAFPEHGIVSEESDEKVSTSEYKWIIDPIDGTVNFANAIPLCCVSIGLEYKGEMLMGAVFNPIMNEFFFAEKGKGAFLNDEKISVSDKTEVLTSCLVTGFPYTYLEMPNGPLEVFSRLIKKGIPVRRLGSAAIDLCWVAAGRFDGFWEQRLSAWDIAAGIVLVREAGGAVSDLKGGAEMLERDEVLATNSTLQKDFLPLLAPERAGA